MNMKNIPSYFKVSHPGFQIGKYCRNLQFHVLLKPQILEEKTPLPVAVFPVLLCDCCSQPPLNCSNPQTARNSVKRPSYWHCKCTPEHLNIAMYQTHSQVPYKKVKHTLMQQKALLT